MRHVIMTLTLAATASCARPAQEAPPGVGLTLVDPTALTPGSLRVLVYHDMEGLSGQDDPKTFSFINRDAYPKGQALLVADLNAVIGGLFDGGATQVEVLDAHGSGNPEPDVLTTQLDPRATQVFRDADFRQYVDVVAPNAYDAVVAVAMHAKTGSRGFASHTYNPGMDILINGTPITETELVAYSWGRVGVPVIMVTGDDRLKADLQTMPWIAYVVTKEATAADSATLRPVAEVHAEMRAAAKRALEKRSQARVPKLGAPMTAGLRATPPANLEILRAVPGIAYRDQTVEFTANDFGAAYDGVVALIGVARQSYSQVMREAILAHPDSSKILADYSRRLFGRWMDVESGRYQAPAPPTPAPGRKYHGAR
jgi:D-amino peptidase